MAFITNDKKPRPEMEGKKYVLNQDVSNMGGTFEKGTEMVCVEVRSSGGISLKDSEENGLLLNTESFKKCCDPL